MASKKRPAANRSAAEKPKDPPKHQAPEGYQTRGGDVTGFWDPESGHPIHFIPREANLSDSKLDSKKPSTLVIGTLVDAVPLYLTSQDGKSVDEVQGQPGDTVGVWAKPGMAALKNLAHVKVYMYPNGEKNTGKPNPMKLFEVLSRGIGKPLQVVQDRRVQSRHLATWLTDPRDAAELEDVPARTGRRAPPPPADDETDEIPF